MNIWVFWNRANGENFATTHLTEKGAYLAAIDDVVCWLGAQDDPDNFFKSRDIPEKERLPHLEEELKKMSRGKLYEVFMQWAELTWDDYEYECEIMETRIQG